MGIEENKQMVRNFFTDINNNVSTLTDINKFRELSEKYMSADYILHTGMGDLTLEQDLQFHNAVFVAFPDLNVTIEDIFGVDDRVFARLTTKGTHKGTFHGAPPTGNKINLMEGFVFRIDGGKFVETWNFNDTLVMYRQLGLTPPSQS